MIFLWANSRVYTRIMVCSVLEFNVSLKFIIALLASAVAAFAQRVPTPIPSLKRIEVPKPANLSTYVRDQNTLIALGKALFWDLQVGSDGKVACATCHFHAGADHRLNNQLSNGLGSFAPNYRLTA